MWVPPNARGRIAYAFADGDQMVAFPRSSFWTSLGSSGGTSPIEADLGKSDSYFVTATGNLTFSDPVNGHAGDVLFMFVRQDGTGGRNVTFGSDFRTGGTVDTTANTVTSWQFVYSGSTWTQVGFTTGMPA